LVNPLLVGDVENRVIPAANATRSCWGGIDILGLIDLNLSCLDISPLIIVIIAELFVIVENVAPGCNCNGNVSKTKLYHLDYF
jgi:hypothetical protein